MNWKVKYRKMMNKNTNIALKVKGGGVFRLSLKVADLKEI